MDLKSRIGRRIKELRTSKGWSQEELAEKIERSAETISHLERGVSLPSLESCFAISEAFHLTIGELLEPAGAEKTDQSRQKKLADIMSIARQLDEKSLNIAAQQIRALIPVAGSVIVHNKD